MPWNSTSPTGSISVKANRTPMQQNTTYIETTMGNSVVGTNTTSTRDHFWDVGSNEDGRHRFMQSPAFTVGAVATDPVIGTGMDGVLYLKTVSTDDTTIQGFYRNAQGVYQYIPTFVSGSLSVTSTPQSFITVPQNVYGEIFFYLTGVNSNCIQYGVFHTTTTGVSCGAIPNTDSSGDTQKNLRISGGTGFNISVRTDSDGIAGTWNYKVTYRAK